MKLQQLKKKINKYPYVTDALFYAQGGARKTIKNQIVKWVKDADIIRLRRGVYTLNNDERSAGLSKMLIANILYYPSYISLEYALGYWQMIPEAVFSVTSVSPKKTQEFSNDFGAFIYKNIKKNMFFGCVKVKDEFNYDVLIATPEKTLLDFFYLKTPSSVKACGSYFEESLRLQNTEQLDIDVMKEMAKKYRSPKIDKIVKAFIVWKEEFEHA